MKLKHIAARTALWAAAAAAFAAFVWWQNNSLTVCAYEYESAHVGAPFDGFCIVQISDLHNKQFGAGQSRLLAAVAAQAPDAIVVTGDLIDDRAEGTAYAREFITGALAIAPVYYVTGNHESRADKYGDLLAFLKQSGVAVLDGEKAVLSRGGETLELLGVGDPEFDALHASDAEALAALAGKLRALCDGGDGFRVLLSHRPELIDLYADFDIDLVFTGHAHGGQWRLPFIGGLYAPDQGVFPKYTAGPYVSGDTTQYVSRGLGSSVFPLRLFNRPQVVAVTLRHADA